MRLGMNFREERLNAWFSKHNPVVTGSAGYRPPVDYFRKQRGPDEWDLINTYKRYAYAFANINANACARVPIKLFVKTKQGDKQTRLRTKTVNKGLLEHLEIAYSGHFTKSLKQVEEVVEHPVLDLLDNANDSPYLNGNSLRVLTHLFQEIVGRSYQYIESHPILGIPLNIFLLEPQYTHPKRNTGSKNLVDYYEYKGGNVDEKYSPSDVIPYLVPNLTSPFIDGLSPHMASWEADVLINKLMSTELGMLQNQARPDSIVSPTKDNMFGAEEALRFERKLNSQFGTGKGGGIYVAEEPIEWNPLNWPPKDLGSLELAGRAKAEIASAFDVPEALIDSKNINKETLQAALQEHALIAVSPRLIRDAAVKNDQLLNRYDDTGRLFLAYDNPVPEDKTLFLQETVQLVMNGIMTPNEGRDRHNLPSIAGGDKLRPINVPAQANAGASRSNSRQNGSAKK